MRLTFTKNKCINRQSAPGWFVFNLRRATAKESLDTGSHVIHLFLENKREATSDTQQEANDFKASWEGHGSQSVQNYEQHIVHFDKSSNRSCWSFRKCCLDKRFADGVKHAASDTNQEEFAIKRLHRSPKPADTKKKHEETDNTWCTKTGSPCAEVVLGLSDELREERLGQEEARRDEAPNDCQPGWHLLISYSQVGGSNATSVAIWVLKS